MIVRRFSMARALVTGGSGFIGGHLADHLLAEGDEVRVLLRNARRPGRLDLKQVDVVEGDIRDIKALESAVTGIDIVYHLAGLTVALSERGFDEVNRGGAANLAAACARRLTPPVLVAVSSLAAAGPSAPGRPRVESEPCAPISAYGRSKLGGEHALRGAAGRLPVTIVRPPGVIGPRERNLLSIFQMVSKGWYVTVGSGVLELSMVEVRDLAVALRVAAARGQRLPEDPHENTAGVYYVAQREHPTLEEVAAMIARALGRPEPRALRMPVVVARGVVAAAEAVARVRRRQGFLNFDKLRELRATGWTCSPERAERELGIRSRNDLAEALRQMAEWYCKQGWLRSGSWSDRAFKRYRFDRR
jgi:nucleoside-diphosphate-sugar epimerase